MPVGRGNSSRSSHNLFQRLHKRTTRGVQHPDSDKCECNGAGWILSECDSWTKCGIHYDGQPHPEERTDPGRDQEGQNEPDERYVERRRKERIEDPDRAYRMALIENEEREEEETAGGGENGPDTLPF